MKTHEPVQCGGCGKLLRRSFYPDGRKHDTNEVYSRTLVNGEFLPSCSRRCHAALRAEAGLSGPEARAA